MGFRAGVVAMPGLVSRPVQSTPLDGGGVASGVLPGVYEELRKLARARMARLPPGQLLQPTALVHEAYLRLNQKDSVTFEGRGHFFFAAARAMRDIIAEVSRVSVSRQRRGHREPVDFDSLHFAVDGPGDDFLALHEVLDELERADHRGYELVMLRFFAGLTENQTATVLGVSERTVRRDWHCLRVMLHRRLTEKREAEA